MSRLPTSLSSLLAGLAGDGYEVELRHGLLLVHAVPYVNHERRVLTGTLVSELSMDSPESVGKPGSHQMHFIGEHPCYADGRIFSPIQHSSGNFILAQNLCAQHYFSHKPRGGYSDYHSKVKTYVRVISDQAKIIDPSCDARTWKVAKLGADSSPFAYTDTASTRAGILAINERASNFKIAIVGLGGTGGYVLDFMARTYVREIHLFDGDFLRQHNAFRTPGAIPAATLERRLRKVEWFAEQYGKLRDGVIPHAEMIGESNVLALKQFDYVFLCIDRGAPRAMIMNSLNDSRTVVIDCGMGMGISTTENLLWGTVRTTISTPHNRTQAASTLPTADRDDEIYKSNIQICEMNALNAAMAVARWKRHAGIFVDDQGEFETTYNSGLNKMNNKAVNS